MLAAPQTKKTQPITLGKVQRVPQPNIVQQKAAGLTLQNQILIGTAKP